MQKGFMLIAILLALVANILGAFGTHALKGKISAYSLSIFQTGTQYQFYHSLALLALAILMFHIKNQWVNAAGIGFILGCILFSGSLYILSVTGLRGLGMITPLGGLAFIMGWLLLFIGICKAKF
ncbi:DUF423 domain-containing protein [Legionella brunensis]|uniref:Transmembrane protein n=1 Tax=Legionella brunensis TaxID=29422 RepID=A0A0W0SSW7_9GAMM|nr:DUF423 domain-containing protein [Legionella brunensis]KTC86372.1 hypothetical protein Lbru_0866 [Legionella brunensis]